MIVTLPWVGPREKIMGYFASLGYSRPEHVDEADYLQELPTIEGRRFISSLNAPTTAAELANKWRESKLYKSIWADMKYHSSADAIKLEANTTVWYVEYTEKFAGNFWFCFKLCLDRQTKVILRDNAFIGAHVGQSLIVGAVAGSLFSNLSRTDMTTLNGFMFNTMLFGALSAFSMFPIIYDQKAVFYKQKDSLFFSTASYTLAQAIAYLPIQIIETILYVVIVYWSAGLSDESNGSRFLTFILLDLVFSMCISQLFRLVATCVADMKTALPITGLVIMVMILFSGFIQPKSLISDGWIWFYWINPVSWALKSAFVNELTSSRYDFLVCTDPSCTQHERYGDFQLKAYGNPTEEVWIWYCFAVLVGMYMLLFFFTYVALEYVRTEPVPLPPVRNVEDKCSSISDKVDVITSNQAGADTSKGYEMVQQGGDMDGVADVEQGTPASVPTKDKTSTAQTLPFDPVTMAFKDVRYTVTLLTGEDVDLLNGVSGFFEPGTVTALMGSSGAGKTTLLDVLAGRKNTGVVTGDMFINGLPKIDRYFRQIMGYVEQFDCLHQRSTPKETITFNAALRLPADIDK
ncbi:ATP-binding cassette domain-containing protein [archaeon]|nr:MAG: ATP-binding cassette domain-containing protein [archaeon]